MSPAATLLTKLSPRLRRRSVRWGIDLGAHAAKVVVAHSGAGRRCITAAARFAYPAETAGDPLRQVAALGAWLQNWGDAAARGVVCSLPSTLVEYEAVPWHATDAAIETAVASALEQLLGAQAPHATCDYWRSTTATSEDFGDQIHLVWASNDVVAAIPQELSRYGLTCRVLDAAPAVLARVHAQIEPASDAPRLVADLGHDTATFAWIDGEATTFLRHRVPLATAAAVDRLAEELHIQRAAAETLLAEWGFDRECGALASRVEACCDHWLQALHFEFQRTLSFIRHRTNGRTPGEIVLCGGGSAPRGLAAIVERRLGIATRTAGLPADCDWSAAEPYSSVFALAASLVPAEDEA